MILIFAITWVMDFVRRSLPTARIRRWLTTRTGRTLGYPAAAAFGTVTPFCSCSSVPLFIGFVESGILVGVTFAFLITSPLVNEIVIALLLASFGWKIAALYTVCGIVLGVLGGLLLNALRAERWLTRFARGLRQSEDEASAPRVQSAGNGCCSIKPKPAAIPCCGGPTPRPIPSSGCSSTKSFVDQVGFFAYATHEAWDMYHWIVGYLALALVLGAAIHGYLPEGFFDAYFQGNAW